MKPVTSASVAADVFVVLHAHALCEDSGRPSELFVSFTAESLRPYEARVAAAATRAGTLGASAQAAAVRCEIEDILMETKFIRSGEKLFPASGGVG